MQRFLRMTATEAEAAMKPRLVDGKWKQPFLSNRQIALVKKNAIRNGLVGQWVEGQGGWLESWDRPQKHHVMRPPKGHKNERNEFDRFVVQIYGLIPVCILSFVFMMYHNRARKIQEALANMPSKIAEHKKNIKAAKPLKGLEKWLNETDPY
jgi:hypothetical protein